jgi:UDP-N-acetylmuramoylalanine--D-glutamate ligase
MIEGELLEKNQNLTVVGAGVTGRAVIDYFVDRGPSLFVTDAGPIGYENKEFFQRKGISYEEDGHSRQALDSDLLILSPGVSPDQELIEEARRRGIPAIGEIELAYRLSPTDQIVAVTGTNGKSTTVNLIKEILEYVGIGAVACGNIGKPFISVVSSLTPSDVAVVEVSSYQLQTTEKFSPRVAVLTNLEPDHLHRHGSFEKYRDVKLEIFANQEEGDWAIINENLDLETPNKNPTNTKFEPSEPDGMNLLSHQKENVGAAIKAVNCLIEENELSSLPPGPVRRGLKLPHRMEPVTVIDEVEFIDDSKATNPAATAAAIESSKGPTRLLLGGKAKLSGYDKLAEVIRDSSVLKIYLFGEAKPELGNVLVNQGFEDFEYFSSMENATREAFSQAEPGEIVLLSPGCSSFDRFENFEERGKIFKETVESLVV